jgi:PHD/YefM family antitoxin component YafN of YafNO toxin-antitoxin module
MIQVPQIEPVSNLVRNYLAIFAKLKNGPVFLAQRSKPAAVLVSLDEWTATANRLAQLEGLLASKRVAAAIDRGEMTTIKHDDLVKLLAEKRANATVGN